MAYIAEVIDHPGLYLIMSSGGEQIGWIEGMNEDWRWQINIETPVRETALARAKEAALKAARMVEDRQDGGAQIDIADVIAPSLVGRKWRGKWLRRF